MKVPEDTHTRFPKSMEIVVDETILKPRKYVHI